MLDRLLLFGFELLKLGAARGSLAGCLLKKTREVKEMIVAPRRMEIAEHRILGLNSVS